MILIFHRNVSYLSELKALSRAGGHFFVGPQNFKNTRENNYTVYTVTNIIKMWWYKPQKQKLEPFFTMERKRNLYTTPNKKWSTHNQWHPCKLKIPPQTALWTIQCTNDYQNPWICAFIGFKIESNKTISMSYGNQA